MAEQWYVWLVGRWVKRWDDGDADWAIVGLYSSRDKALEGGRSGDWIVTFPLDDTATSQYVMAHELIP